VLVKYGSIFYQAAKFSNQWNAQLYSESINVYAPATVGDSLMARGAKSTAFQEMAKG
jgi:hypothetical protein